MGWRDLPGSTSAASESDTERDGPLSHRAETHAAIAGLAAGLLAGASGRWEIAIAVAALALGLRATPESVPKLGQLKREPWHALGGVAVGLCVGAVLPV